MMEFWQFSHDPGLLLSALTTQAAVISSRIEGSQTTLEEVLKYDANTDRHSENLTLAG